jgi:hypothetical protein
MQRRRLLQVGTVTRKGADPQGHRCGRPRLLVVDHRHEHDAGSVANCGDVRVDQRAELRRDPLRANGTTHCTVQTASPGALRKAAGQAGPHPPSHPQSNVDRRRRSHPMSRAKYSVRRSVIRKIDRAITPKR